MSENTTQTQDTMHAFLVAWGWFAEHIGLIQAIEAVPLKQKRYRHTPQGKVLEFLVAILAGLRHLQDISDDAHPLVKDRAVAEAWGQAGWADYSGVSRTLSGLSWDEAREITSVLERISEPFVKAELQLLQDHGQRLCLDGDLTGLPVSSTSQTYPNAAYGYMDDEIRLGYQAGLVSLQSPTYGRLWLSVSHHPGDTVSSTQAEDLVLAAERRLDVSSPTRIRVRPHRRTELLQQRIHAFAKQVAPTDQRRVTQERAVAQAEEQLREIQQALQDCAHDLIQIEDDYRMQQRPERPTGRLAQARKRVEVMTKRLLSREKACQDAQRRLDKTRAQLQEQQAQLSILQQRLDRFEKDNAGNPDPVIAEFRLDAGFGTYENIALLIEMGYEVYTKPHSHQVVTYLRKQVDDPCSWKRVGANAELIAWPNMQLKKCPYPLDVALERFYTGQTLKHSALLHFGTDPVTHNLAAWFQHYNGRQTIEAGIKESKQVFSLHRIKVRSEPAIYLQESFVIFAANFIRWAWYWFCNHNQPEQNATPLPKLGVKRQVHVGAHVSAQVIRNSDGRLLKFSEQSRFAGLVLQLPAPSQPLSDKQQSLSPYSTFAPYQLNIHTVF